LGVLKNTHFEAHIWFFDTAKKAKGEGQEAKGDEKSGA